MNNKIENLTKALEEELLQPEVRKSADKLKELLADEFIEFGDKRYGKEDIIELLTTETQAYKYTMHDFKALEIAPDIILATYLAEKEMLETGAKSRSLRSSLWQNRDGKWQMIFHQGTPIQP